jgi:Flp pilus assembly pilin Flp
LQSPKQQNQQSKKRNMKIDLQRKSRMAKRTRLGRMLCRLAGDQTGAVLMEYVILGVLIAAAATLAAIYFGKGIVGSFTTMTHATTGKTDAAAESAKQNQEMTEKAATDSDTSRKNIAGGSGNNDANK